MKAQKTDRTERQGIGIAMTAFESSGFAFREQSESDYGIDAHAELIQSEEPTGQLLGIQLKSGASYLSERCDAGFVFRTDEDHAKYWLNHALPVLICLCDVEAKNVYWQVVTHETALSTGKGYKFIVPSTQLIDSSYREPLQKLLFIIYGSITLKSPVITGAKKIGFGCLSSSANLCEKIYKISSMNCPRYGSLWFHFS